MYESYTWGSRAFAAGTTIDIVLAVFPFAALTSRKKTPVLIVPSESLHGDQGLRLAK